MKNIYYLAARTWIKERTSREKIAIFILGLFFIYLLWFYLLQYSILNEEDDIKKQISSAKNKKNTLQQQLDLITSITNSNAFIEIISAQKQLSDQSQILNKRLSGIESSFTPTSSLSKLLDDIIKQKDPAIDLISLQSMPKKLWNTDEASTNKPFANMAYLHGFEIEFHSDYFHTLNYLSRLEKLPWYLYWDSLEYKVIKYPQADIVLKFHVLTSVVTTPGKDNE